jgi:hypothetical protein
MPLYSRIGETASEPVDRFDTGLRVLLSLLFLVIVRVLEAVFAVVIIFGLLYTLITQQEPAPAVKRFSERVLAYAVQIVRYLTYNSENAPFPFRDFPAEP